MDRQQQMTVLTQRTRTMIEALRRHADELEAWLAGLPIDGERVNLMASHRRQEALQQYDDFLRQQARRREIASDVVVYHERADDGAVRIPLDHMTV